MPRTGRDRLHLDLATRDDPAAEAARLVGLGATRSGERTCEPGATALVDPDGNGFCLLA